VPQFIMGSFVLFQSALVAAQGQMDLQYVLVDTESQTRISKLDVQRYFSELGPGRATDSMNISPNIETAIENLYAIERFAQAAQTISERSEEEAEWVASQSVKRELATQWIDYQVEQGLSNADWDALAREYYQVNKQDLLTDPKIHTRHILVSTDERPLYEAVLFAESLRQRILAGEDFAALAQEYSDGPSGETGGDLGFTSPGQLVPEFERAVSSLNPGELADLTATAYGVHIIELIARQAPEARDYESVREELIASLRSKRRVKLREEVTLKAKLSANGEGVLIDTDWIALMRNPATREQATYREQ